MPCEATARSAADQKATGAASHTVPIRHHRTAPKALTASTNAGTALPKRGAPPASRANGKEVRGPGGGCGAGGGDESPPDPSRIGIDDSRDGVPDEEDEDQEDPTHRRELIEPSAFARGSFQEPDPTSPRRGPDGRKLNSPPLPAVIHNMIDPPRPPPLEAQPDPVTPSPSKRRLFPISPAAEETPLSRFSLSLLSNYAPAFSSGVSPSGLPKVRSSYGEVLLSADGTQVIGSTEINMPKTKARGRSTERSGLGILPRTAAKEEKLERKLMRQLCLDEPKIKEKDKQIPGNEAPLKEPGRTKPDKPGGDDEPIDSGGSGKGKKEKKWDKDKRKKNAGTDEDSDPRDSPGDGDKEPRPRKPPFGGGDRDGPPCDSPDPSGSDPEGGGDDDDEGRE